MVSRDEEPLAGQAEIRKVRRTAERLFCMAEAVTQQVWMTARSAACEPSTGESPWRRIASDSAAESYWLTLQPIVVRQKRAMKKFLPGPATLRKAPCSRDKEIL